VQRPPAPDLRRLAPRRGSNILIAGGCGGIGAALVQACLANDLRVAVMDLAHTIDKNPPPPAVPAIALDATSESSVLAGFEKLRESWSSIDHLAFLIGFTLVPPRHLDSVSIGQWEEIIAGNLRSAFLVTRSALPLLARSDGASIVMVSSGLGFSVLKGFGPYGAAKAGIVGLTKALAAEHAPRVRANAVAPSAILTPFMGGGAGRGGDDPKTWEWFESQAQSYVPMIPMARLAVPEDVVGPMLFLMSDAARFITGQTIHINGGRITP
jgi:3-oxoacyl-[acyl-carrier protein] reductase